MPKSRRKEAFEKGREDYREGVVLCPYERDSEDPRYTYWWSGWYHRKIEERLGDLFERNNIEW